MSSERRVLEVLARYVRAADHRDGAGMASLFVSDAEVEIFHGHGEKANRVAVLRGAQQIGQAVAGMMSPHPALGWSHHTTSDHIVEVTGDTASLDAQFIVFRTLGIQQPAEGWPAGAVGAQGTVVPFEAGYYRSELVLNKGAWLIRKHRINLDLPPAFPAR